MGEIKSEQNFRVKLKQKGRLKANKLNKFIIKWETKTKLLKTKSGTIKQNGEKQNSGLK